MRHTSNQMQESTSNRPLVTFALFAYNQENYIREAVNGAFAQTYEPLEIILSDDDSSDQTFAIMQQLAADYNGPHQVRVRKSEHNLGLAGHVNEVFSISKGAIIILAAGDDISLPRRSQITAALFEEFPNVSAVLLSADLIEKDGNIIGRRLMSNIKEKQTLQTLKDLTRGNHMTFGATRAVRRDLVQKFPPLRNQCPTEDTPLLVRSLICGDNILSHQKGILYRKHEYNLGSRDSQRSMNLKEIYHQYYDDICHAETAKLISKDDANSLRVWVRRDEKIREIKLQKLGIGALSLVDLFFILPLLYSRISRKIRNRIINYLTLTRRKTR